MSSSFLHQSSSDAFSTEPSSSPIMFTNEMINQRNLNSAKRQASNLSLLHNDENFQAIKDSQSRMFSSMGVAGTLPKRAMSISYLNKATQQQRGIDDRNSVHASNDAVSENLLKAKPYSTIRKDSDYSSLMSESQDLTHPNPLKQTISQQSLLSDINVPLLKSVGLPQRASVDLSIPLDPTYVFTPEDRLYSSRSNTATSLRSADDIMGIEKQGENLFNSSIRSASSSIKSHSPMFDPSMRFSTADAKRISLINMNQSPDNNNNNTFNEDPTFQDAASFKNPFSVDESFSKMVIDTEPQTIRHRMSQRKKSLSISQSPETAKDISERPAPHRRRSSLLASGDVLSMKMGVLTKTSSSVKDDESLRESRDNSSIEPLADERALKTVPDSEKCDLIKFRGLANDDSTLENVQKREPYYLDVDPLDTNSRTNNLYRNIETAEMSAPSFERSSDQNQGELQMKNRVQSITENTKHQIDRSNKIKSSCLTNQSDSCSDSREVVPKTDDDVEFSYIKLSHAPKSPIDLSKAEEGSNETLSSDNAPSLFV